MNKDSKNDKDDDISFEESEKRIINFCITKGILFLLVICVNLTLVQVFMIDHQPTIFMPQFQNNIYGKGSIFQTFWKPHCCPNFCVRDFKFGLIVYFSISFQCAKFQENWTTYIRHFIRVPPFEFSGD
mgnify:CR=1 FL=1